MRPHLILTAAIACANLGANGAQAAVSQISPAIPAQIACLLNTTETADCTSERSKQRLFDGERPEKNLYSFGQLVIADTDEIGLKNTFLFEERKPYDFNILRSRRQLAPSESILTLFQIAPEQELVLETPLPAAGFLMIAGIGAMFAAGKKRKTRP